MASLSSESYILLQKEQNIRRIIGDGLAGNLLSLAVDGVSGWVKMLLMNH
ncbi:hypothetical protein OROMI_000034 [Orobanche minor]